MGIVTVTASAAIDRSYRLHRVSLGGVNRADSVDSELSGKGVNVAAAIAQVPLPVRAVLPLRDSELHWTENADFYAPVAVSRDTRVNISVIEEDGATTKINERAVPLEPAEWEALVERSIRALHELGGGWLALFGTIPPIAGGEDLAPIERLLSAAESAGARVAVDTSGEGLRRAVAHSARLDLVKPNTHELAELIEDDLDTVGDVVEAARDLQTRYGIGTVYVSMGSDGALVVGPRDYRLTSARAERVVNTVGAGGASLAGYLCAVSEAGTEALDSGAALAASWGALAVSQLGTVLRSPRLAPEATITVPAAGTALTEPGRA